MASHYKYSLVYFYLYTALTQLVLSQTYDPERFKSYLAHNRWASGLPQSYYIYDGYFESIPQNQRPKFFTQGRYDPLCQNQFVTAENLNAYQYQTEQLLASSCLNLYDGSMWEISLALLGDIPAVEKYETDTLVGHKTLQFANIKANKQCRGVSSWNQCTDSSSDGSCGLCYGDAADKSLPTDSTYFFRMISDVWSYEGTEDKRCPTLNGVVNTWKWNDYRPVLGENSWANLIGPLQVAYLKAGKNVNNIPDSSNAFKLALNFIPALEKMLVPNRGAVYYAPRNTWDQVDSDIGSSISTENNVSLLAGLRMLYRILTSRSSQTYGSWNARVASLIANVENYLRSTYLPDRGYFSQGGKYDPRTSNWTWVAEPFFAVDCQTWAITVLGKHKIDSWFGEGTTLKIWENTKRIGGYKYNANTKSVDGVGFSDNHEQVFSSEWSLGAINMLRVISAETADPAQKTAWTREADYMRSRIESELVTSDTLKDGTAASGVKYANKRYWIPFGWYANPVWSTASVAWTVTDDLRFNPFFLGGLYKSDY